MHVYFAQPAYVCGSLALSGWLWKTGSGGVCRLDVCGVQRPLRGPGPVHDDPGPISCLVSRLRFLFFVPFSSGKYFWCSALFRVYSRPAQFCPGSVSMLWRIAGLAVETPPLRRSSLSHTKRFTRRRWLPPNVARWKAGRISTRTRGNEGLTGRRVRKQPPSPTITPSPNIKNNSF